MTKLAVVACVLFLVCTSQAFTFSGLQTAIGKPQSDIESILSKTLKRIQKAVEQYLDELELSANNRKTALKKIVNDLHGTVHLMFEKESARKIVPETRNCINAAIKTEGKYLNQFIKEINSIIAEIYHALSSASECKLESKNTE